MNRRQRRNEKLENNKDRVATYKESDFNKIVQEEVNKEWAVRKEQIRQEVHERVKYEVTRVIFNCMINALHGEYRFGAQRLQNVIDVMNGLMSGITEGNVSVDEVRSLSKKFNLQDVDL